MNIFLTILGIVILIIIFSLPLLIAQRWVNHQKRNIQYSSRRKKRASNYRKRHVNNKKRYTKTTHFHSTLPSLFEAIISMQTKIAKCDGFISVAEADYITQTIAQLVAMAQQHGFNAKQFKQLLVHAHKNAKLNNTSISLYARKLRMQPLYTKEQILQQLISIATIDNYTQLKESLIFNAGTSMGLSSLQIRSYIDRLLGVRKAYPKDNNLYKILGCISTDSNATIKKSYRKLAKENHPDILYAKGLSISEIELAQKKMQKINMAYEKIKRERKI